MNTIPVYLVTAQGQKILWFVLIKPQFELDIHCETENHDRLHSPFFWQDKGKLLLPQYFRKQSAIMTPTPLPPALNNLLHSELLDTSHSVGGLCLLLCHVCSWLHVPGIHFTVKLNLKIFLSFIISSGVFKRLLWFHLFPEVHWAKELSK